MLVACREEISLLFLFNSCRFFFITLRRALLLYPWVSYPCLRISVYVRYSLFLAAVEMLIIIYTAGP